MHKIKMTDTFIYSVLSIDDWIDREGRYPGMGSRKWSVVLIYFCCISPLLVLIQSCQFLESTVLRSLAEKPVSFQFRERPQIQVKKPENVDS